MVLIVGISLLFVGDANAETTHSHLKKRSYQYTVGHRSSRQQYMQKRSRFTSGSHSNESNSGVTLQSRPSASRPPSNGPRTQNILKYGGTAATQVCGGPLEITNRQGKCNELEYDKDFLNFVQTEGMACSILATKAAFGFTPTKIRLRTNEGSLGRGLSSNGKTSTHSTGRALDVFEVDIFNGPAVNSVMMHKNYMNRQGHRTFYAKFQNCWKASIKGVRGTIAGSYGSGCLGFEYNAAHHDHMHISLPPMDDDRKAYKINAT